MPKRMVVREELACQGNERPPSAQFPNAVAMNQHLSYVSESAAPLAYAVPRRATCRLRGTDAFAVTVVGKEIVLDLIDAIVGIVIAKLDQIARVLRGEQQIAHQVGARSGIASQAVDEILDQIRHVLLMLRCDLRQVGRWCDLQHRQRPHLLAPLDPACLISAAAHQLIQPFQMLDVRSQVVEEHHVEQNSHDLRQRRIFLVWTLTWCSRFSQRTPMAKIFSAPSRMMGLSGCCNRKHPSPKNAVPFAVSSFTGWKTSGIAADAQMCSTVILVASVTRRLRFHMGWPFWPWMNR